MAKTPEPHPCAAEGPAFALESNAGTTVKLSQFKGRTVVLYFYPRDNTRVVPWKPMRSARCSPN